MMQLAFYRLTPGGVIVNLKAIVSTGLQKFNQAEPQLLKTGDQDHSPDKTQLLGEDREDTGFGDDAANI